MNIDAVTISKLVWGIGVMSAIIGAGVSSVFMLINGWRERIAADKRHLRELAMQTAIEAFTHQEWAFEHVHDKSAQMHVLPIDYFFVHYLNLATVLGAGKPITKTEFLSRISEIDALRPELRKWAMNLPKTTNVA
jgi:hypothetical protein